MRKRKEDAILIKVKKDKEECSDETCENIEYTDSEQDSEKRIINLTDEQVQRYGAMIEKIVIASARENGLDKNAIVCIVFPRPISSPSIPPKPSVSNVFK